MGSSAKPVYAGAYVQADVEDPAAVVEWVLDGLLQVSRDLQTAVPMENP